MPVDHCLCLSEDCDVFARQERRGGAHVPKQSEARERTNGRRIFRSGDIEREERVFVLETEQDARRVRYRKTLAQPGFQEPGFQRSFILAKQKRLKPPHRKNERGGIASFRLNPGSIASAFADAVEWISGERNHLPRIPC